MVPAERKASPKSPSEIKPAKSAQTTQRHIFPTVRDKHKPLGLCMNDFLSVSHVFVAPLPPLLIHFFLSFFFRSFPAQTNEQIESPMLSKPFGDEEVQLATSLLTDHNAFKAAMTTRLYQLKKAQK